MRGTPTLNCTVSTETPERQSKWAVHFERTRDLGRTWELIGPVNDGAAMRASTGAGPLVGNLVNSANTQLNYGSQLDPLSRTQITNSVRAGQAARGMGYGQGDANAEALAINAGGEQLRQQRIGNAQSAAQLSAGLSGNADQWAHQNPMAVNYANNAYQIASTNGANIFRPESQYLADLMTQKYQANLQTNQANALLPRK